MTINDYEAWQQAVKDAYPDHAAKLRFKGRIENGKDTVSAEIPGLDRSFGVWDSDKDEGVVLTAALLIEARIKTDSEYSWLQYTGKGLDVMNDAKRTLHLEPGDKFGVRKSSNGKYIRLITERDGPTKVFTVEMDVAQHLGKQCKPTKK